MKKKEENEFDRYKELKYISLWIGIPIVIGGFLLRIRLDIITSALITICLILVIGYYLQYKEAKYWKEKVKNAKK